MTRIGCADRWCDRCGVQVMAAGVVVWSVGCVESATGTTCSRCE